MRKILFLLGCTFFATMVVQAQEITPKSIPGQSDPFNSFHSYLQVKIQNDVLKLRGDTDRYFTNGIKIAVHSRSFLRNLKVILARIKDKSNPSAVAEMNSFAIGQNMYTPVDIRIRRPLFGDRPYAGHLYASIKRISSHLAKKQRITSELSLGVIGPWAQAEPVQKWWHGVVDYRQPEGWDYQIKNDIAINYYLKYEQSFSVLENLDFFEFLLSVDANIGTLSNNIGIGSFLRFGHFNNYFANEFGVKCSTDEIANFTQRSVGFQDLNHQKNVQYFFFVTPTVKAVLDNSLLQGGLFSYKDSPVRFTADEINRFYFESEYGIGLFIGGFGVTFSQVFRTAEFPDSNVLHWGGISLYLRT